MPVNLADIEATISAEIMGVSDPLLLHQHIASLDSAIRELRAMIFECNSDIQRRDNRINVALNKTADKLEGQIADLWNHVDAQ